MLRLIQSFPNIHRPKRPSTSSQLVCALLLVFLGSHGVSARIVPAATVEDLDSKTTSLAAGDTMVVAPGFYDMSTWEISGLRGTETNWIVIRGAEPGKAVIRSTSGCCNLVQMSDLAYVKFEGFEITMKDSHEGIDGINMDGKYSHHVTMENLLIRGVTNNGISLFPDSAAYITLLNSEIDHAEGSGLYWGYPGRNLVHDVLVQGNYIHHCPADSSLDINYGIQFKGWGYRGRFLDNVLHDVGGTTRSGLIVYYGKKPLAGDDPADRNIVAGNVLWNCRNEGITVMSDALIENNLVMDADIGINIQTYGDESFSGTSAVENLTVRNNTVFRCRSSNIAISGWANAGTGVSFTGNASYQDQASKIAISGSLGKGVESGNVAYGTSSLPGVAKGRGLEDFARVSANSAIGTIDFYPSSGSALLNTIADLNRLPSGDFNGTIRPQGSAGDAGAYEALGTLNPGWKLTSGFKSKSTVTALPGKKVIESRRTLPLLQSGSMYFYRIPDGFGSYRDVKGKDWPQSPF